MYDYLIVGAGFAGAVCAEIIATQLDKRVLVVEKRNHIGGNAYDYLNEYGILVHKYGPHIFHTNSKKVFDYLSKFTEWIPYEHKVLAQHNEKLYPIPINRTTLNKLYNMSMKSESEVREYLNEVREIRNPVLNSEDIIIDQVGNDLFERFYKYYTKKQWGLFPDELSSAVCGRVKVRANSDDRYFTDKFQYMPKDGYSKMFERILDHKNIEIILGSDYKEIEKDIRCNKIIYTGPIDYYFDYQYGKLHYRSIDFGFENIKQKRFQAAAVINYVDSTIDYSRVTEYKYFNKPEIDWTTISKEYFTNKGDPFYPILNETNKKLLRKYVKLINQLKNVIFIGRLAEYKYYNMDQIVGRVLNLNCKF